MFMKGLHLLFILSSLASFIGRVALSELNPRLLQLKFFKIIPHVLDTLLLASGIILVIQGNWLHAEYGWIISKLIVLFAYVGFGVACMRSRGQKRWLYLVAAMACFAYIFIIAVTKHGFIG